MQNKSQKINIAIKELSEQNKSVLGFYFTSAGRGLYRLVRENDADARIYDVDFPGAIEALETAQKQSQKPAIIFSMKEKKIENTIWLAKPLSAKALTEATPELLRLIEKQQRITNDTATEVNSEIESLEPIQATDELETAEVHELMVEQTSMNVMDVPRENISNIEVSNGESELASEYSYKNKEVVQPSVSQHIQAFDFSSMALISAGSTAMYGLSEEKSLATTAVDFLDEDEDEPIPEYTNVKSEVDPELMGGLELTPSINSVASENIETLHTAQIDAEAPTETLESISIGEQFEEHTAGLSSSLSDTVISADEEIDSLLNSLALDSDKEAPEQMENPNHEEITPNSLTPSEIDNVLPTKEDELFFDYSVDKEIVESNSVDDSLKLSSDEVSLPIVEEKTSPEVNSNSHLDNDDSQVTLDELSFNLNDDLSLIPPSEVDAANNSDDAPIMDGLDRLIADVATETEIKLDNYNAEQDISIIEDADFIENDSLDAYDDEQVLEAQPFKQEEVDLLEPSTDTSDVSVEDTSDTALQTLLNEIRQEAGEAKEQDHGQSQYYQKSNAEKRWLQLCGEHEDLQKQKDITQITFQEENHLLQVLLNQINLVKNTEQVFRLKYKDLIIAIDCSKNKIYCNLLVTDDEFSKICFAELDHAEVKTHDLDYSEVRLYRNKMKENSESVHSIESFVWTTSLLTAQGRLPRGTDLNKKIGLKIWPNLTRVESFPYAMNIAAVLSKYSGSLLEISKLLKIPQRYVFSFYYAALTLDMIETNTNKLKKKTLGLDSKGLVKKSSERGLFSRLLKRLKS